jgi:hypothetical protein
MLCSITFFFLENGAVYGIKWKNIEGGRPERQNGASALHAQ